MDMKRILQAMDKASTPVNKADNEMKRFVSIIATVPTESKKIVESTVIPQVKKEQAIQQEKPTTTNISKYLSLVEQELTESKSKKTQKSQKLAQQVIKEMGGNYGHPSNIKKHISQSHMPPDTITSMAKQGARKALKTEETEGVDSVTLDIPLFIRLMEFAREDAQDDMILHRIAEKLIGMAEEGQSLSMSDYEDIVGTISEAHGNSKIYDKCWTGYKKVPGKTRGEPGSCKKK